MKVIHNLILFLAASLSLSVGFSQSIEASTSGTASPPAGGTPRLRPRHLITHKARLAAHKTDASFDPPEETIGERLFLETRFSQFFFANSSSNANFTLLAGDPVMDTSETTDAPFIGPFAGQGMNCRACHLVDEQHDTGGNRTYCDFSRRSPIPDRGDGRAHTPRNSPPLVNALLSRGTPLFLHFDGQFATAADLVIATMTGRNYGWLPLEGKTAGKHIAHIIRDDDGSGDLAQEYGGFSYRTLLTGTDANIPPEFLLPRKYRLNVARANDKQILQAMANLVQAYMEGLVFSQDENGEFNGSPYDVFLQKNSLPRKPAKNETPIKYSRRLLALINQLSTPQYVTDADGAFETQIQSFQFGSNELAGLKIFLTEGGTGPLSANTIQNGKVGNCVICHTPPAFSDFLFHNTGATQEEYDSIHGEGAFAQIFVPTLAQRARNPAYLPASPSHPNAIGQFITPPSTNLPGFVDLGLWNEFRNPDQPIPQHGMLQILNEITGVSNPNRALARTIALFKTAGLRDLSQSAPYLHTARMNSLEEVVEFYKNFSGKSRPGLVRNGAAELSGIALTDDDITSLAAFLRALNEDYD